MTRLGIFKKPMIVSVVLTGLLMSMLIPVMTLGFISAMVWGPEVLYTPWGLTQPSTYLFLFLAGPVMLISAIIFVALVVLPVFARYDIPLKDSRQESIFSLLARWMQKRAIDYARLMDKHK